MIESQESTTSASLEMQRITQVVQRTLVHAVWSVGATYATGAVMFTSTNKGKDMIQNQTANFLISLSKVIWRFNYI